MAKRSRFELYLEVLRAINRGINKPTNIMYKCNLSWINCRSILKTLIEQELITVTKNGNSNRRTYGITEKGRALLEYFSNAPAWHTLYRMRKTPLVAFYKQNQKVSPD